jgi:Tfp pilus assembly protein PilF
MITSGSGRRNIALLLALLLAGCALLQPSPHESVVELTSLKAEQALLSGIRQYEEGNYNEAEGKLKAALAAKLVYPKDQVLAYKYLAFIYCGSNRQNECAEAFRQALTIDPKFQLTARESGHPIWGPLFKSVQASGGRRP